MPAAQYNAVVLEGTGTLNNEPGYSFKIWLVDRGEPGTLDSFRIEVRRGAELILEESGLLAGGNIQIHPPDPK